MATAAEELRDRLAKPEKPADTLKSLGEDLQAIGERIADNLGELTPELEAELDAIEEAFDDKATRVFLYRKECELRAEKAKAWAKHYGEQANYWTRQADGMTRYLLHVMERVARKSVHTVRAKFSRVLSPVKYRWSGDTYEQIPERFRKENPRVYSLDLDAVKRAVAEGEMLPPEITAERGWHIR